MSDLQPADFCSQSQNCRGDGAHLGTIEVQRMAGGLQRRFNGSLNLHVSTQHKGMMLWQFKHYPIN